MRRFAVFQFLAALFLFLTVSASQAFVPPGVPSLINYQGRLTDGAGAPVTSSVSMTFTLYDAPSGGKVLWSEGQMVTVTDGVFDVQLGAANPIPSDVFSGDTVYLGVTAGSDPEMTPRGRITSDGYAFNSDMVDGMHATDMVAKSGDTMTGTLNITFSGTSGNAAYLQTDSASNGANTLVAATQGTGSAGLFSVNNPANVSPAVFGITGGSGNAGNFQITNGTSTADALYAATSGSGNAGNFGGKVNVTGNLTVGGDATVTGAVSGDGANITNVNAALLQGQNASDIINAAKDEVRTPISSLPFTINSSGSYYLTGDLTHTFLPSSNAITINVDNVTIDLMGFSLIGPGPSYCCANNAIYMNGHQNIEVRNGTIRNFGYCGIANYGATGKNCRIINTRILGNNYGILLGGPYCIIRDCVVSDSVSYGIMVGSNCEISGCTITGCGADGVNAANANTVKDCIIASTQQYGISVANSCTISGNTLTGCTYSAILTGSGGIVTGNNTYNNQQAGINVNNGSLVSGNTSSSNQYGIYASSGCSVTGNTVYNSTAYGIYASGNSDVSNNTVYNNQQFGINCGNACNITGNTVFQNNLTNNAGYAGIRAAYYSMVKGNTTYLNNGSNIYINGAGTAVENNFCSSSPGYGIYFVYTGNYYKDNRTRNNGTNFAGNLPTGAGDGGGNAAF